MNETFAQNLKSLRKQHNLSQQQLADHLNVHIGSITKWEKDYVKPRTQKIEEIAEFFNISPDELKGAKLASDGTRKRISRTELKKHKTIGQKLKALREHHDLNYTQLGKEIGSTSYTISKWEKEISKPYDDGIQRLADFFGVDYEELAGEPRKDSPIGDRIKALRTDLGIGREELSEKIGMSAQSIHSWEQGKSIPRNKALEKLAEVFNVTPEHILGEDQVEEETFENEDFMEEILTTEILGWEDEKLLAAIPVAENLVLEAEAPILEAVLPTVQPESKILEFSSEFKTAPAPVDNEIVDLEVLFSAAHKRLIIGEALLTAEEKKRAINVLKAIFSQ